MDQFSDPQLGVALVVSVGAIALVAGVLIAVFKTHRPKPQ